MTAITQSWLQLLTAIAALGGFFAWQTHYIDKRIDDLKADLIARIEALERRLTERIERLEHPVSRS